jgi:hypothetical protein
MTTPNELVDISLGEGATNVVTVAFRAIIAVYPEAILEVQGDSTFAKRRDVIAIRIDGGRVFHVDPQEGEIVRQLWTEWAKR